MTHRLRILGTRGIPASHGGFETFAEQLALHLVGLGWDVAVYCQTGGSGPITERDWRGVRLLDCPTSTPGALGTLLFDWRSTRHAARAGDLVLTLGYNTAAFLLWYRLRRVTNLMNMDGIEWRRDKWSRPMRLWLRLNERLGGWLADHLIADHPGIRDHLLDFVAPEKITVIPYGAHRIDGVSAETLQRFGVEHRNYCLVIARPEPENSILEIVQGFSRRRRGCRLVVLGGFEPRTNPYHRTVQEAASDEVLFPGAVYEQDRVAALRRSASIYIHGHRVGGTNPSLVEALGASCPVLVHDNLFNAWVAGEGAPRFTDADDCDSRLTELLADPEHLQTLSQQSVARFEEAFTWPRILGQYTRLLERWAGAEPPSSESG